jgi:hypothetical protein
MLQFLITMAGAFFGTIAAAVLLNIHTSTARPSTLAASTERAPSSKWVVLAAGTFAVVAALIFYFMSAGLMTAAMGAIVAVVTLIILAFVTRAFR